MYNESIEANLTTEISILEPSTNKVTTTIAQQSSTDPNTQLNGSDITTAYIASMSSNSTSNSSNKVWNASLYYLGCFADYSMDRDLPMAMPNVHAIPMTIEQCVDYCRSIDNQLAGLQA